MGNIPLVQAGQSALTPVADTRASGDSFGAQTGRALIGLGGELQQAGATVNTIDEQKRQDKQNADVATAAANSDFTRTELELRKNAPADGAGLYEATSAAYDKNTQDTANTITDDATRARYINTMNLRKADVLAGTATYQYAQQEAFGLDQSNRALDALQNKARSDPSEAAWANAMQDGTAIINGQNITAKDKAAQSLAFQQNAALAHFEGALDAAKTIGDFNTIEKTLTDPNSPWQARMDPKQFDAVLGQVASARKAFGTVADTTARAMIATLKQQDKDNVAISQADMKAAQDQVSLSNNTQLQADLSRIARNQEHLAQSKNLTNPELQQKIDAARAGGVYPGVPPEASAAFSNASNVFRVTGSFLGGTMARESGNDIFKPSQQDMAFLAARGDNLDVGGLDANFAGRAQRAITAAELATGAKAQINDAYRPPERQAQYYANYIRKPYTFNGVTYQPSAKPGGLAAPPHVTGVPGGSRHQMGQALDVQEGPVLNWLHLHAKDYGLEFLPGQAFSDDPVHMQLATTAGGGIDHGHGSQGPGAQGIFQFQPQTWLDIMHDGVTPQRFGLDVTGKSDTDLLALRDNLQVSAYMTAAYAEKNTPILAAALGHEPSDTELYFAHFLGPTGAVSFLKAYNDNPQLIAANVVPDAAAANKSVFYQKGKALTVEDVYHNVGSNFTSAPDQVGYGDSVNYQSILDGRKTAASKDYVQFNNDFGRYPMGNLGDPNGFVTRGQQITASSQFWNMGINDIKPFSMEEAAALNKSYSEGDTNQQNEILGKIQELGQNVAQAAYKQLGVTNPTMEVAGRLKADGYSGVANDVLIGQKKIDSKDPVVADAIGGPNHGQIVAALSTMSNALSQMDPKYAAQFADAATAHYVATHVGIDPAWSPDAFKKSMDAVLGGFQGSPATGVVNSATTILPRKPDGTTLDAQTFNIAVDHLSDANLIDMSANRLPPRFAGGQIISAGDVSNEATFKIVSENMYKLQFASGGFAMTIDPNTGQTNYYIFNADPAKLTAIAAQGLAADQAGMPPTTLPMDPYGALLGPVIPQSIYKAQQEGGGGGGAGMGEPVGSMLSPLPPTAEPTGPSNESNLRSNVPARSVPGSSIQKPSPPPEPTVPVGSPYNKATGRFEPK